MKKISSFFKYFRLELNNLLIRIFVPKHVENKKYYASLCSIFRNEGKYLKEWIDYHLIVGFEHFYIYNNFSEDNYREVLAPYIEKGIVTLTDWPYQSEQMRAYNDCVKKYSSESNWIAFMDLDEFALPLKYHNIKDWLQKYEKFPCVLSFFRNFSSNGHISEDTTKPIIEQFTMCTDFVSPSMFLNTRWTPFIKEFRLTHFCRFKYFNKVCPQHAAFFSGLTSTIKNPEIVLNHYYCKSLEYYIGRKMVRGDAFFKQSTYCLDRFYNVENQALNYDCRIYKYLTRLKNFNLEDYQAKE